MLEIALALDHERCLELPQGRTVTIFDESEYHPLTRVVHYDQQSFGYFFWAVTDHLQVTN